LGADRRLGGDAPGAAQIVQPIAQFMAASRQSAVSIAVFGIVKWRLNPDIYSAR